jgi:hypothetical protein
MFVGLDNSLQAGWLLALLVLWAAFLFGGFLFGTPDARNEHRMPTSTRMVSSLILVVAAWSWFLFTRQMAPSAFSLLIALGMTFGFVGDLFLAHLLPFLKEPVIGGIGAFGLGHVAYIAALIGFGDQVGLNATGPRWLGWLMWLLIGVVAWYLVVFRGGRPTALHWLALPYALLLASTVGFATGLAVQSPAFIPLAVGGALFLLSDLILAAQLFNSRHFPLIGDAIWLTYGPAQMLIVYTAGSALLALAR